MLVYPGPGHAVTVIDPKIANIRQPVEDGLSDTDWANARLRELMNEKRELEAAATRPGLPPQIDAQTAMGYRRQVGKVLAHGEMAEGKRIVSSWVQELKLAPEKLTVDVTYRIPEPVMNCVVARVGFEPTTSRL